MDDAASKQGDEILDLISDAVAKAASAVRLAFVRKVMGIFLLQLAVTSAIAAGVVLTPAINAWLQQNPLVVLGTWAACLVLMAVALCTPEALRSWPVCLGFLAAFTMAEGALVGFMFVVIAANAVIVAVIATGCAVLCILGMTASETLGLSKRVVMLASSATAVAVFVACLAGGLVTVAGALGGGMLAVLFCAFIAADVLAIVGGKHRCYEFSIDEPLLAATCLYVDVLGLFMYSLSCAASAVVRT